jgi:hypothetical protein
MHEILNVVTIFSKELSVIINNADLKVSATDEM